MQEIASTLEYLIEEGYNDRFSVSVLDSGVIVNDTHMGVGVCSLEYDGQGYFLHPVEDIVDSIKVPEDKTPWSELLQFVDLYDIEHPVSKDRYIEYLETRIEHLEDKLSSKHAELIADEIKLSNKSDEIKTLKAENERLAAELTKQTAYNEILMKLYFEL